MQGLLLREHIIELRRNGVEVIFVSSGDTCKISTGQPGQLQTGATRSRHVVAGMAAIREARCEVWQFHQERSGSLQRICKPELNECMC